MRYKEHDFNVGDKVIFVEELGDYDLHIGDVKTITKLGGPNSVIAFDNGLELIILINEDSIFEYIEPYLEEDNKLCMREVSCDDERVNEIVDLTNEYRELQNKILNLNELVLSNDFYSKGQKHISLIDKQKKAMNEYLNILEQRVRLLQKER